MYRFFLPVFIRCTSVARLERVGKVSSLVLKLLRGGCSTRQAAITASLVYDAWMLAVRAASQGKGAPPMNTGKRGISEEVRF